MTTLFNNYFSCSLATAIAMFSLLILALIFYGKAACHVSKKAVLKTQPFTLLDAFVATILVVWFVSVIITSFGKDQNITFQIILFNGLVYVFLIGGIFSFLSLRHLSPTTLFGFCPPHPSKIVKKALLWLLAVYPLIMISQGTIEVLFGTADDTQAVVTYFLNHPSIKERLAMVLMAVIVAPFAEEFIFRGYLYGVLRRFAGRIPAIVITSLLFSVVHLHLPSMLGLGLLAVMLCLLYECTGSLWANICVHATFNTISILMLLLLQKGGS